MTSANLLLRVRTMLDEASASYWSDAEIYAAATDGQSTLLSLALAVDSAKEDKSANQDIDLSLFLSYFYSVVTGTVASGTSTITLSGAVLEILWLLYNPAAASPLYPVRFRRLGEAYQFQSRNQYLSGTSAANDYYAIPLKAASGSGTITLETASTNNAATYNAGVITQPADIAAGQSPTAPDIAMDAIATFAFGRMMIKDQRNDEANAAFARFLQMAQGVIQ